MEHLTIGQVAKLAEVNVETVRYYERRQLVARPPRSDSGYRQFPPEAVQRIRFIKRAQELGFTLQEIKELLELRADPQARCADVRTRAEAKIVDIEDRIRTLQKMKRALAQVTAACAGRGSTSECPILDTLDRPKEKQP